MLKDLVKVASRLNSLGLSSEANFIDSVVRKFAGENSKGRGPERVYDETPTRFNQALPLKAETEVGYDFIDPSEWTDQPGRKGGDWGPSKETEDAERIEGRHNKQYRRRDGGHSRGHGRGASEWDSLPLSDDARDGHRSSKYPPLEYDSEGRIIFPEDRPDFSGEPVTHFRRREPTGGGGRRIHVPSEAPSSYTGDEDLVIERLAKRLSSLGLTKEARTLISIVKSANDDFYADEETDEPSYYSEDEAIESIDDRAKLIDALNRMDDRTFRLLRVTYPEAMEALLQRTEGERQTPEQIHKRKLRENSNVNKYYYNK